MQRSNEILAMQEIFGDAPPLKWKGYRVKWCGMCDCATIISECCNFSSCCGGGCDKCKDDHHEFLNVKSHLFDYLNEEEIKIYHKIEKLMELIPISIGAGQNTIDWKSEVILDNLGRLHEEIFAKEINE